LTTIGVVDVVDVGTLDGGVTVTAGTVELGEGTVVSGIDGGTVVVTATVVVVVGASVVVGAAVVVVNSTVVVVGNVVEDVVEMYPS
jgi:hypothetical protein